MKSKWNVFLALMLILSLPRVAVTAEDDLDPNILSDESVMADAPAELPQTTLTRNASTPMMLQGALSKNIFRNEEHTVTRHRSVPYDVQVPYQDTETYYTSEQQCGYRSVPVCENTPVCHMEPGERICEDNRVCRQVPDPRVCENHPTCRTVTEPQSCHPQQECHNESLPQVCEDHQTCRDVTTPPVCENRQVCHPGPDGRQRCENHQVCHGGGTRQECTNHPVCHGGGTHQVCSTHNVCTGGGSHQECTDHEVCHGGGSHQECENHPVCHTGPSHQVCENHQVCHNESQHYCEMVQVPHTREVTRYRTETRYRDETYTEIVTEQVFVRQVVLNYTIQMPEGSQLQGNETEKVFVKLAGLDQALTANVQIDSPVFNYKVFTAQNDGNTVRIVMNFAPKYSAEDLGEKTISGFSMISNAGKNFVQFKDKGQVTRVKTQYTVAVLDLEGHALFQTQKDGVLSEEDVKIAVTSELPKDKDVKIVLAVSRAGTPLAGVVAIRKEITQPYQLDTAIYGDANKVQNFVIEGNKEEAKLVFDDLAPADATLDVKYEITLIHQKRFLGFNVGQKVLTTQTFNQKDLIKNGATSFALEIAKFTQLEDRDLNRFFKKSQRVIVKMKVARSGAHLNGGSPLSFEKFAKIKVK